MHSRGDVEKVPVDDLAAMVNINLRGPIVLSGSLFPICANQSRRLL